MLKIEGSYTEQKSTCQDNLKIWLTDGENFTQVVNSLVKQNYRLASLFGTDDRKTSKTFGVHSIMSSNSQDEWIKVSASLPEENPSYPALTNTIMAAIWYEKYLMDMFGITAENHPDPRRLVHHENIPLHTHPLRKDFAWNTKLKKENHPHPMMHVEGNGIFEIPVGPIHAGIIEPGHFRFNVAGERIITLEGKLFFTHKGAEKLLEGKTIEQALPFIERLSDDSAASNALAFVQAVESICKTKISDRATLLRTLVVELERITMHIHDLANIAGMGTGYTIMAAQGFRIKENLVRLSEDIFGNRFWRGFIIPGGVNRNLDQFELKQILLKTTEVVSEIKDLLQIGLSSDGLLERMVSTGLLSKEAALAYGATGIPARATDLKIDTRIDHPYAAYSKLNLSVVTKTGGDVFARYMIRVGEVNTSFQLIKDLIHMLEMLEGPTKHEVKVQTGEAISAVEGWRGEILHFVRLDEHGKIDRLFPRDPSFCHWPLFGEIGPGNIVPDFPLCNKSLNLSYSGTDL